MGWITFLMEYGMIVLLCLYHHYSVDYTIRYVFLYLLILAALGHYRIRTNLIWEEIHLLIIAHIGFYFAALVLVPLSSFTKIYIFRNTMITGVMFIYTILLSRSLRILLRKQFVDHVLIIGTGEHAKALDQITISNRFTLSEIIGYVKLENEEEPIEINKNVYQLSELKDVITRDMVDQVVIAQPSISKSCMNEIMETIHNKVQTIKYLPQVNGIVTFDSRVEDYDGILVITSVKDDVSFLKAFIKRLIDLIGGIVGCICLIPLTIYVRHSNRKNGDDGPIFFTQIRIGKDGKPFKMYKYRTMVEHAEEKLQEMMKQDPAIKKEYEENKKLQNDPRITKAGAFLRQKSLDEFPQLINVVKGQMSLVGPRPYLPREECDMGIYYESIVKCKPGITGMWQSHGRSEVGFEERCKLDDYYYHNWNIWLDITILIKTAKVVIYGKGAM